MFNSISGQITYKDEERLFLSTGSIEWEVHISRSSSDDLPEEGQRTRVYIYLYHRDDQLRLYGFSQNLERDVFLDHGLFYFGGRTVVFGIGGLDVATFYISGHISSLKYNFVTIKPKRKTDYLYCQQKMASSFL